MSDGPLHLWNEFCHKFDIGRQCVPMFVENEGVVSTKPFGRDNRPVLHRSSEMESMLNRLHSELRNDFETGKHALDGILYFMMWLEEQCPIPLYIGRSLKLKRDKSGLSTDITDYKFGRWSDDREQHFGELTVAALGEACGRSDWIPHSTYTQWATRIFDVSPCTQPKLKRPVYFWATTWGKMNISIGPELGPTTLIVEEKKQIANASLAFPGVLLNSAGT